MHLKPSQVRVQEPATCIGTLGKSELDNMAACIVLYHWEHGLEDWTPISRRQIAEWLTESPRMRGAACNPFWKIDLFGFMSGGWITGWLEGFDHPGTVTEKFIEAVSNPRVGDVLVSS